MTTLSHRQQESLRETNDPELVKRLFAHPMVAAAIEQRTPQCCGCNKLADVQTVDVRLQASTDGKVAISFYMSHDGDNPHVFTDSGEWVKFGDKQLCPDCATRARTAVKKLNQ